MKAVALGAAFVSLYDVAARAVRSSAVDIGT